MSSEQGMGARVAQLAALAAKTAKIAAAASAGGPHGAAIEAVKQFLPQIIKVAAIVLIITLLLPVLLFAGIPHFLFGWAGNNSADILDFTNKAILTKDTYNVFDTALDKAVTNLVSTVNTEGYGEVEVHKELDNTNLAWVIAIIAVKYEQNLNRITPELIVDFITNMLVVSVMDENRVLKIFIRDPGPQALMLYYGFTDEQKQWAQILFDSMTEDQTIREGDPDYSSGVDYGEITYREGSTAVTYYNQTDSRWGNTSYGVTGTIGRSGCGPTALAIVVSSLTGKNVTPVETAAWASRNGYYIEGSGSRHALIPDGAKHYGLSVEGAGRNDAQKVVDALASGKLVVAIMSAGHFTSKGHFIVLRGVTADGGDRLSGKILVADPNSKARSEQLWDLELILNETNRNAAAGGPLWIVG